MLTVRQTRASSWSGLDRMKGAEYAQSWLVSEI